MNFPAHAWTAHSAGFDQPHELLGTMLPDLAALVGVRFSDRLPVAVANGRRLHHRADACFHDHAAFRSGVSSLRSELRAAGLATGSRRAAAHVGFELLLDATLHWDAEAASAFDSALASGAALVDALDDDAQRERWAQLVVRLREVDIPSRSADVHELAERVELILRRRPRLALGKGDRGAVIAALANAESYVAAAAPELLGDLVLELRSHADGVVTPR